MNFERFSVVIFCDAESWVATNIGANHASDLIDQLKAEECADKVGLQVKEVLIQAKINELKAKLQELEALKQPVVRAPQGEIYGVWGVGCD